MRSLDLVVEAEQVGEGSHAFGWIEVFGGEFQLFPEKVQQHGRQVPLVLEAHHRSPAAVPEAFLNDLHQVLFRVLFHGKVRVPGHADHVAAENRVARKDPVQVVPDKVLEGNEVVAPSSGWEQKEAGYEGGGHMDEAEPGDRQSPEEGVSLGLDLGHQHRGPIAQAGKGVARIHRQGREQGLQHLIEIV